MSYTRSCIIAFLVLLLCTAAVTGEECPEEEPLKHYFGPASIVCPCFAAGEEAGIVVDAPADHYPIQILRIGIGWGSQFGGSAQQIEEAINIYASGLPNPGTLLHTLPGPVLTDGAINEFNIESQLGEVIISSGPFTVTLKFLNPNAGDPFSPSTMHDGVDCQTGKNVVYAIPGGWYDACDLGITGDWIFYVIYRRVNCLTGTNEEQFVINGTPAYLWTAQPNPFGSSTRIDFYLAKESSAYLTVYDIKGGKVAELANRIYMPGRHSIHWDGTDMKARRLASGVYFFELRVDNFRSVQKVIISR